ncbi:MAG: insulinase family protein [Lentisphaeria bacterium]|nr:insulinase family protein [Lentisphaeria bacterium]
MRKSFCCLLFFLLTALPFLCGAWETKQAVDKDGFAYEYIPDDPFSTRTYVLENGLKVFLSRNTIEPRITSLISVRTGGADDPEASTGLAHYFEHMMFKGNGVLASLDWEKEAPLLDELAKLFDQYRKETDPDKRAAIYREIDKVSGEAAKYSNDEYWTLVRGLGATDTNAWTGYDETVYINNIPSNALDKYLYLESVRFSSIALRRFHTEIEAVYEEFNRSQNNDGRRASEALRKQLFLTHPYGRDILGLPEHLKSPSMSDITLFFYEYYQPANMAIILAGDLNYEEAMRSVRKYFGVFRTDTAKQLAARKALGESGRVRREQPIESVRTAEVVGPDAESLQLAFRFEADRETEVMLEMINSILNNNLCGIMELNLELPRKVMSESSGIHPMRDYLLHVFSAEPAQGKTLEETRDLILGELEKLKRGEFPDWLPGAIVNNERMALITISEDASTAAHVLNNAFIEGRPLVDQLNDIDAMEKITKEQITEFAKKHYRDNYVIVYKRQGEAKGIVKAVKPPITPVAVHDELSEFGRNFELLPVEPEIGPVYADLEKELHITPLADGITLFTSKNDINERFSLSLQFPVGTRMDKELALALGWIDELGTDKYTAEELRQEWYKLAARMGTFVETDRCGLTLSGLQRNFKESLALFNHVISNVKADPESYKTLVDAVEKSRADRRSNRGSLLSAASGYAIYGGPENYAADILPVKIMREIDPEKLIGRIHDLRGFTHDVVYYGPAEDKEVKELLADVIDPKGAPGTFPKTQFFQAVEPEEDMVFVVDYPGAAQAEIEVIRLDGKYQDKPYDFEDIYSTLESRTFMNELRERQALAYSVGAGYSNPGRDPNGYSMSYGAIGTQHDKFFTSLDGVLDLLNKPETGAAVAFESSRQNLLSQYRNVRVQKEDYYGVRRTMKKFDLKEEARKTAYEGLLKMSLDQYLGEAKTRVAGKKNIILILADLKQIDRDALKKYGKVRILKTDELFPND